MCVFHIIVLFRLYDSDGDGRVSRDDVEEVVETMYKMVGPLLAQDRGEEGEEGEGEGGGDVSASSTARVKQIFSTLGEVCAVTCRALWLRLRSCFGCV